MLYDAENEASAQRERYDRSMRFLNYKFRFGQILRNSCLNRFQFACDVVMLSLSDTFCCLVYLAAVAADSVSLDRWSHVKSKAPFVHMAHVPVK